MAPSILVSELALEAQAPLTDSVCTARQLV